MDGHRCVWVSLNQQILPHTVNVLIGCCFKEFFIHLVGYIEAGMKYNCERYCVQVLPHNRSKIN